MSEIVKIKMTDYKNEYREIEFLLKDVGIKAFQYNREMAKIGERYKNSFDLAFESGKKYFEKVIGREAFKIEGMSDDIKFPEMLEEFFINDPMALDELSNQVGLFLYPALKNRMK